MQILLTVLVAVCATSSVAHAEKPVIAVMAVEGSGIEPKQLDVLSEVLATELTALARYNVVSSSDIQAMLQHESQKQSLGCDDTSCFSEIGGALGADNLLVSQVSMLGDDYIVSIKLIDVRSSQVRRRVYERVDGGLDDVVEAIRFSLDALTDPNAPDGIVRGRALVSTPTVVLAGVAVAALAVGTVYGLSASSHYGNATDPNHSGSQIEVSKGEAAKKTANIAFGAGVASGIAAVVTFFLVDFSSGDAPAEPSAQVIVNVVDRTLGLALRF